jgi:coenzyme F420-reducing hydrogenase alpha subunit
MNLEGRIAIQMTLGATAVKSVHIESRRLLHTARVLHGRPMTEAVQMVPRIFSLCGTAQACAAAQACEQASGIEPSPGVDALREALVDMESLREHLWRILLDWPGFYGGEPQREAMAKVIRLASDYRTAVAGNSDPFLPGVNPATADAERTRDVLTQLADLLHRVVFALPLPEWLALQETTILTQWAQQQETVPARLIRKLLEEEWSGSGACQVSALVQLEAAGLAQAMGDDAFIEQPQWQGECRETGSLPRNNTALLSALRSDYGNGLLTRVVARLTEVALLWQKLAAGTTVTSRYAQAVAAENIGIGQVAAARGQLVHRVELDGERIRDYRILAPTEWNFHPQGVVARALTTLRGRQEKIEQQARLLIDAIDPCVAYELHVHGEATHA